MSRKILIGLFSLCLALPWLKASVEDLPPGLQEQPAGDDALETVLARLAKYCEKFGGSVLWYTCHEEVEEIIYTPSRTGLYSFKGHTEKARLVYDYQLIRKDQEIEERRVLLEENGLKTNVPDAPLKVKRFPYRHLISGPLGLFSPYWQPFYNYKIAGEAKINGEKALVIEAQPKTAGNTEYLFGRAWVRAGDSSVLKIEYSQESVQGFEELRAWAEKYEVFPHITITTEFAFEKKGIRFPSRCLINEAYRKFERQGTLGGIAQYTKSRLTVAYSGYLFFTVETDVTLKRQAAPAGKG